MKIHKEIVWNKGENPKKDGEYLLAQFDYSGTAYNIMLVGYTVEYGWNTSDWSHDIGWGQTPNYGDYAWAENPF